MIAHSVTSTPGNGMAVGPRYALIPVQGFDIAVATVARMLDGAGDATQACILVPGEHIPS